MHTAPGRVRIASIDSAADNTCSKTKIRDKDKTCIYSRFELNRNISDASRFDKYVSCRMRTVPPTPRSCTEEEEFVF